MEIPKINAGIFKEKDLLDKLSLEISRDFSISEKLAKKFIFETHLSLEDLKNEILNDIYDKSNEINEDFDINNKEKLEKLLFALKGAKEFIEKASQSEINELKNILEKNNIENLLQNEDSDIIKKTFPEKLVIKAKNPTNIGEHIMGGSLGIINSGILIVDVFISLGKGLIMSIPDFINILSGKADLESFKKV